MALLARTTTPEVTPPLLITRQQHAGTATHLAAPVRQANVPAAATAVTKFPRIFLGRGDRVESCHIYGADGDVSGVVVEEGAGRGAAPHLAAALAALEVGVLAGGGGGQPGLTLGREGGRGIQTLRAVFCKQCTRN